MYSTRTFAQLTGVTVKTLRHYERIGLLAPKRTAAGYRRYSLEDLQRLERVLALKSLGLPLNSVKTVLKRTTPSWLRTHREWLEDERARLDRAIETMRHIEQAPRYSEALDASCAQAAWDRWESMREQRASTMPRAPDRAGESRIALFRAIDHALVSDPSGADARELAKQWRETIEPEALRALRNRAT
jgi:DNA-binding transcriptional MerR regulator